MEIKELKKQLLNFCSRQLEERIKVISDALSEAKQAGEEETKSSVGDKYETGRAMMQLEIEKNASVLAEAIKQKKVLSQIPISKTSKVQLGSLMITSQGNFFIAISTGQYTIENILYTTISLAAPLAQKAKGLQSGGSFNLNGKNIDIIEVT